MAGPTTPGEERRNGLRRSRWIAAGASVGAAALLTGTIAAVNAAPSQGSGSDSPDSSTQLQTNNRIRDDEYEPAEPFSPQSQTQVPPQLQAPLTSSRGS